MSEGINDKLHDELIAHDVDMRRVDGDARKRVEARIDVLAADLKGLMAKIDPFGTDRADAQERRMKKLDKAAAELIAEAYGEISAQGAADMKRVARTEAEVSVQVLEGALS